MTRWLVSFLLRRTCTSRLTRSTSQRRRCFTSTGRIDVLAATIGGAIHVLPLCVRRGSVEETLPLLWRQCATDRTLALGQVLHVIRERSPPAAGLEHPRQHADVHVDRAVRDAGLVPRALELRDRRRGDRRERHVAEVLLDEAEPFLLELDRARGAPHPLGIQVGADRIREPLRPLFVGRQPAVSSFFDELAFSARRRSQIRRAQTLPVSTAGDGEVGPGTAAHVSRGSYSATPRVSESSSDEETDAVSTALARTKSATSAGKYRTERPSRRKRGPFPRCLHARSVATESPSSSATSRSVSARASRLIAFRCRPRVHDVAPFCVSPMGRRS